SPQKTLVLRLVEWRERRVEAHFVAPPFPYFPASPLRNSMLTSSSLAFNALSSLQSAAAMVSVSCSTRLAPRMTEVMAGFASTQATDKVVIGVPCCLAISLTLETVSNSPSCQYRWRYICPNPP